jgi:hypothetical protein
MLARWEQTITDEAGNRIDQPTIRVEREVSGLPLAVLKSDKDGATPLSNPFTPATGVDPFFHTQGGFYKITITKGAYSKVLPHVALGTAAALDTPPLVPSGAWDGGTTYSPGNVVRHAGSSYWATVESTNKEPTVAGDWADYWVLLAEAGTDGTDGVDGASALTVVRVATTTNVNVASALENGDTLDGVALATGDLVLLAGQTAAADNGVYVVPASGTASRHSSFNTYDAICGAYFSVMEGTAGADKLYRCVSDRGGTLGSTDIEITEFSPVSAPALRNRIVNGGMRISQENGTSAGTASGYYPVDEFSYLASHDGTISVAQVASATPGGSTHRLRATVTGTDTSVGASQYALLQTKIEGPRVADALLGSASARSLLLRFGVKAPAGTYCVSLQNSALSRSYVAEFVITGGEANTDAVRTLAVPGDTAGTWLTAAGAIGLHVRWALAAGSSLQTAAGSWAGANYLGTANQANLLAINSQVFELFDVGLYVDPDGAGLFPAYESTDYTADLQVCKRYYQDFAAPPLVGLVESGVGPDKMQMVLPVEMCGVPALTVASAIGISTGSAAGTITAVNTNNSSAKVINFRPTTTGTFSTASHPVVQNPSTPGRLKISARL